MILNAIDEVLFWQDLDCLIQKTRELMEKYYPHDPDRYFAEKDKFYLEHIGSKEAFCRRLALYQDQGAPVWTASRTGHMDDLSAAGLEKAFRNASREEAAARVVRGEAVLEKQAPLYDCYTSAVLNGPSDQILELTIGAGTGTCAVMRKMGRADTYTGIDIDFRCAKTADGLGRHYGVSALGMCCNLWGLPFDGGIFSAVCSNCGLEECREVPAILREAVRVLRPGGRLVLHCVESGYLREPHRRLFDLFGFSREEAEGWLREVRLYADFAQLDGLAEESGLVRTGFQQFEGGQVVLIYTK